jgi:hypothetical protein
MVRRTVLGTILLLAPACGNKQEPTTRPDEAQAAKPKATKPAEPKKRKPLTTEEAIAATVLVATPWGHGTGVFVHEDGWVLTNHHVVAPGATEDFGYRATVTLGKLREDGSVETGEQLQAIAHKVDAKHDLALLKIVDPKQKFPSIYISAKDPRPGTKVSAIGNAGVGFGWALKNCSINAVGDAETFASVIFQNSENAALTDDERKRVQEEVAKAVAERGKQVQTDCNILPGDSGGPLVDAESNELVGLNASIRPATSGFVALGSVAFHVHVAEIRTFMKDIPDVPTTELPDPWDAAGQGYGRFADADEDGEIDTLRFEGVCASMMPCYATLIDLDQSSLKGKKDLPNVDDVKRDKSFDAELAVVQMGRMPRDQKMRFPVSDVIVFANTDGKGKFDKVIVADGETFKTRGYVVEKKGIAKRDASLDGFQLDKVPTLFTDKKRLHKRAETVAQSLSGAGRVDAGNPDQAKALQVSFRDNSGDGTLDTLETHTRLDTRIAIDLDQDVFHTQHDKVLKAVDKTLEKDPAKEENRAKITERRMLRQVRQGKLHGEFLAVLGAPTRVFYDTNKDGKYDLLLEGDSLDNGIALRASTIDAAGKTTIAKEHLGRKLLRPGLAGDPKLAKMLDSSLEKAFPGRDRAALDDGKTSFPNIRREGYLSVTEVPRSDRKAFAVIEGSSMTVLADLDSNTFSGKRKSADPTTLVKDDKFDAEFAMRFAPGLAWAYYDRDNDGRFDLILVSEPGLVWQAAAGYAIDKKGKITAASEHAGKSMFQPDLLKNKKLRPSFSQLEKDVFRAMWY